MLPALPDAEEAQDKTEVAIRLMHDLVERTNLERATRGLPPLKLQDDLSRAAVAHARDMARFGYFGHCTPHAPNGIDDFEAYAVAQRYPGKTGQNLYHGEPKATQLIDAWMKSEEHRENILDEGYNEVGFGFARGRDYYDTYCVQFFGIHKGVFPVVINNEAYSTSKPQVHLYLYGKERMRQMRFSNDGKTFTSWEPYRCESDWTLTPGEGKRTVTVEMTDGDMVVRSEDSIVLTR